MSGLVVGRVRISFTPGYGCGGSNEIKLARLKSEAGEISPPCSRKRYFDQSEYYGGNVQQGPGMLKFQRNLCTIFGC